MIEPNLQVQDISKVPLLCHPCDSSFSDIEDTFLQRLYIPLLDGADNFKHEDGWLQDFAIFLAWKTIAAKKEDVVRTFQFNSKEEHQNWILELDEAEIYWRSYLKGEHREVDSYEHHLLFSKFASGGTKAHPLQVVSELCYDSTIVAFGERLTVLNLMTGCIFLSPVTPRNGFAMWRNTRISRVGRFDSAQVIDGLFVHGLKTWIDDANESMNKISEKQWKVIEKDVSRRQAHKKLTEPQD